MKKHASGMPSLIWFMLLVSLVYIIHVRNVVAMEIFSDSFNQGNIEDRYVKHGGCYPYSFTQQEGVLRIINKMWEDNRNCKNTWGTPQYYNDQIYYKHRAELVPKPTRTRSAYNNEYDWILSLKFVQISLTSDVIIFQMISSPYQGVDIGLRIHKGYLYVQVLNGRSQKIRKIKTGVWMVFSIRFKRSLDSDGYLQLLIDNEPVFRYDGATTQSDSAQTITKFGLYNANYQAVADHTMYKLWIDDIRVEWYREP